MTQATTLSLWGLFVSAVAGASLLIYLGSRPETTSARPAQVARVVVLADKQELGTRQRGEVVTATFAIRNTHAVAVECGQITRGCSCASASVEPNTVPAGGESVLTVVWNLAGKRGPSSEAIVIPFSGAGIGSGSLVARVSATVRAVVEPDREVLEVSETVRTSEVVFRSPLGRAFKCVAAATNHPSVVATVDPRGDRVQVRFDPSVKGWEYGNLSLTVVTDQPEDREVRMVVRINKAL